MTESQVTTAEHVKRFHKSDKIKNVLENDSNSSTDEDMEQVKEVEEKLSVEGYNFSRSM